jgi:hypothetical protein
MMGALRWVRCFVMLLGVGVAGLLAGCGSSANAARTAAREALFDGRTLTGWVERGGKASFTVEDGCIVGRTAANEPNSFLCTERTFRDFDLSIEFKVDPRLNSGVQIRSERREDRGGERVFGYQIEIDPSARAWTGGLYDEGRRGWLVDLKDKPEARAAFRQGEWNRLRIRAIGPQIQTWLNGVPVVDVLDSMTPEGFIGLQVHGVGARAEPLEVRWRSIELTELGAR